MKAQTLIRWASLEEKRRRQQNRGLLSLPVVIVSVILGSFLAGEISRRLLMTPEVRLPMAVGSASHLWLAAAVSGYVIGVFGAPFRLFWRRDSKLLASLPLPGRSLFALALWRSHLAALRVSIALLCGLVALGALGDWAVARRLLVPMILGFAGAAWLGPAAALAAGAIVASEKAQAMLASMGGEFQAPRTTWLSVFPGLAATAVLIALIACASWTLGERPPGGSITLIICLGVLVPLIALMWAWARANRVVPQAVREVALLDQEILAHVERSTPSMLERSMIAMRLPDSTKLLATKDASLSRRRYPSPYFLVPCGIAALWIVAATKPSAYLAWGGSLLLVLLAYAVVMARRTLLEPIEIPSLLRTLPVAHTKAISAKWALAQLRIGMIVLLGGIPLLLRAPDFQGAGALLVFTTLLALLVSRALSADLFSR